MNTKRINTDRDASGRPMNRASTFGKKNKCPKQNRRSNKQHLRKIA